MFEHGRPLAEVYEYGWACGGGSGGNGTQPCIGEPTGARGRREAKARLLAELSHLEITLSREHVDADHVIACKHTAAALLYAIYFPSAITLFVSV
jgi:hypothetical protein